MKNGKLFGKINVIDLIVLVAAIVIVAAVGLKMTGKLGPARVDTGTTIHYTVKVEGVDREVYENIQGYIDTAKGAGQSGDRLMANGELLNGYVTSVSATPRPTEITLNVDENTIVYPTGDQDLVDLVFEVEGYVSNNIKTELGTQEVRTGKKHILKTTHFELTDAVIQNVTWEGGTGAGY